MLSIRIIEFFVADHSTAAFPVRLVNLTFDLVTEVPEIPVVFRMDVVCQLVAQSLSNCLVISVAIVG